MIDMCVATDAFLSAHMMANNIDEQGVTVKTIELNRRTYRVAGELPNGVFYLEGPRGGSVHFAKPIGEGLYGFFPASGGGAVKENYLIRTATRAELAA